jgi:hypothetical protein
MLSWSIRQPAIRQGRAARKDRCFMPLALNTYFRLGKWAVFGGFADLQTAFPSRQTRFPSRQTGFPACQRRRQGYRPRLQGCERAFPVGSRRVGGSADGVCRRASGRRQRAGATNREKGEEYSFGSPTQGGAHFPASAKLRRGTSLAMPCAPGRSIRAWQTGFGG